MPSAPAFNYCSAAATRLFIKELFYLDTVDAAPYLLLNVVLFSSEKFPQVNAGCGAAPPGRAVAPLKAIPPGAAPPCGRGCQCQELDLKVTAKISPRNGRALFWKSSKNCQHSGCTGNGETAPLERKVRRWVGLPSSGSSFPAVASASGLSPGASRPLEALCL